MPSLFFWNRSWEIEEIRHFVSWVHRTLLLRTGIHLEKFRVDFLYYECFASDVNAWIRFAVKSKVEFDLVLYSPVYIYTLPQYSNSSLAWLRVQRCIIATQSTIEWQSLTGLMIEDVELHEDVIQKILSGCPVLSSLYLRACWGFKHLDFNSESLHELRLSNSEDKNSVPLLEISASYLRSLDISFSPIGKKVQLTNIPSLVSANIHFSVYDDSVEVMNNTMELLEKTQHAKDLILGGAYVEVLSKLVVHGWRLPKSSRRDCLILNTWEG